MTADARAEIRIPFENTYARLPQRFGVRQAPTPVAAPRLIKINAPLACDLGIDPDALASPAGVAVLAGNRIAEGSEPFSMAYAGHQFGGFAPQLGDGRAILLGEVIGRDGQRRDIQLKGSGPTPFSRRGDGRAALGPVLREYIVSEAMHALGVPTTRTLAAVMTGENVHREGLLPGAVLARVASSHIRVGTFQYFAARQDTDALTILADYVIDRHYPQARATAEPYRALLDAVIARQGVLIARWMSLGFIHGVMNTDNCSIAGETIDYGPCAFLDTYDPAKVFSSIDHGGRYAFANQPRLAQWNLARFAETLLPLLASSQEDGVKIAQVAINAFRPQYEAALLGELRAKLGLAEPHEGDMALAEDLLARMAEGEADYTLTFRALANAAADASADGLVRALFADPSLYDAWAEKWRARLAREAIAPTDRSYAMRRVNPRYIPRNHRIEQVIAAAVNASDFAPFEQLHAVLSRPFDDQPEHTDFARPPAAEEIVLATFCGT